MDRFDIPPRGAGGGEGGAVESVNSQTGIVVLDADDIDDSATTNKFATAAELTKIGGVEAGADVTDATNVAAAGAVMGSTEDVSAAAWVDDDVSTGSSTKVPTAAAVKAYVDGAVVQFNTQTASYTPVLSDANKVVVMNVAGANDFTVPPNADVPYPVGTQIGGMQYGAGLTTIVEGAGVNVSPPPGGTLVSAGQGAWWALIKLGTNEWSATGDLASA